MENIRRVKNLDHKEMPTANLPKLPGEREFDRIFANGESHGPTHVESMVEEKESAKLDG